MKLTISICVGVIAGALAALLGIGLSSLLSGAGGVMAGGAIGGALSAAVNDIVLQMQAKGSVNWGRVARIAGIGGICGLAFGAIGACAQRNAEIAAAISGVRIPMKAIKIPTQSDQEFPNRVWLFWRFWVTKQMLLDVLVWDASFLSLRLSLKV